MLTKTKIALAVSLVIGSASAALAGNEHRSVRNHPVAATQSFRSDDVRLGISQGFAAPDPWYIARQSQTEGKQ